MAARHVPRKIERGINTRLRVLRRRILNRLIGRDERRLLFIACFPKSGSTYLMELLCTVTGFPRLAPLQFMGPNEQDMDNQVIRRVRHWDGVCQQHMKGTKINLGLAKSNKLKIVVLTRNIFDVVYSLYDHLHHESRAFPTGYTTEKFFNMEEHKKIIYIIKLHIPWYFNFLLSWHEGQRDVPVHWVTYEKLMEEKVEVISELLRFWDVSRSSNEIRQAIEMVKSRSTRLNKGIVGRGRSLTPPHRESIIDLAESCKLPGYIRLMVGLPTKGDDLYAERCQLKEII